MIEKTFKFDGDKIKYKLEYQGKGKSNQPDKRFDENTEGLCLFIYPSGSKVFYAYKLVEMFNRKKDKLEKNCLYKKMFRYQDVKGYKYRDAKDKLKAALDELKSPVEKDSSGLLFKDLAKRFLKEGVGGARLDDPNLDRKESTKARYTQYVKSILLLKNKDRNKIKDLTKTIIYKNKPANKPIGDYLIKRSKKLSLSSTPKIPVIRDALKKTEKKFKIKFDYIMDLDVSSPLRNIADIKKSMNKIISGKKNILFSVCRARKNPYFNMVEFKKSKISLVKKNKPLFTRQSAPKVYELNASIYIWKRDTLLFKDTLFTKSSTIFEMPYSRSIDIDSIDDFKLVNYLMR